MATVIVPVNASVVSTGKSIRYIGDHCYAYSGLISVASSQGEVTLLEDTSGSGFIVGNELIGMAYHVHNLRDSTPDETVPVLIPPFTRIKLTAENLTADTGRNQSASLVGRVYGDK